MQTSPRFLLIYEYLTSKMMYHRKSSSPALRARLAALGIMVVLLTIFNYETVEAHPWCVPDGTPNIVCPRNTTFSPISCLSAGLDLRAGRKIPTHPHFQPNPPLQYCQGYNEWPGSCCTAANENGRTKNVVDTIITPDVDQTCYNHVKQVYCAFCSPLAGHKFDSESAQTKNSPWLCPRYCGRFYDGCKNVELNTDGPRTVGGVLRVPGLSPNQGKVKLSDFYPTKASFCGNFSLLNVGGCHTDNPDELLTEEGDQMPGVPYRVDYAYPNLDLTKIPKKNPKDRPHIIDMIPYGDGSDRIVVSFQTGIAVLFDNYVGVDKYTVFFDIKDKVAYDDPTEYGYLGMAFHPRYRENGYIYVKYTPRGNLDVISRFTKSPNGDFIDTSTEFIILQLEKESLMHHGGSPIFGSDGMLYIATGEGVHFAQCYRPENPAPLLDNLLGKMLRIDVDNPQGGLPYGIPNDNPFVGQPGARGEIWAYGLRNPWKFTIDPPTRMIWNGDVGYALWEEINILQQGRNYGWHGREGTHCFYPKAETCPLKPMEVLPIFDYPHTKEQCKTTPCVYGRAVTGGYVYRGTRVPSLSGVYLFADYDVGTFWMLTPDTFNPYVNTVRRLNPIFPGGKYNHTMKPATFGIDINAEIYLTNWDYPDIFKFARELTPPPIPPPLPPKAWDSAPLWGDPTPTAPTPADTPFDNTSIPSSPIGLGPYFPPKDPNPPYTIRSPSSGALQRSPFSLNTWLFLIAFSLVAVLWLTARFQWRLPEPADTFGNGVDSSISSQNIE